MILEATETDAMFWIKEARKHRQRYALLDEKNQANLAFFMASQPDNGRNVGLTEKSIEGQIKALFRNLENN